MEEEEEEWNELCNKMKEASSLVGTAIKLWHELEQTGFQKIGWAFVPVVQKVLHNRPSTVISGYATVLWFTSKVSVSLLTRIC